jgi:hypothetical protein
MYTTNALSSYFCTYTPQTENNEINEKHIGNRRDHSINHRECTAKNNKPGTTHQNNIAYFST